MGNEISWLLPRRCSPSRSASTWRSRGRWTAANWRAADDVGGVAAGDGRGVQLHGAAWSTRTTPSRWPPRSRAWSASARHGRGGARAGWDGRIAHGRRSIVLGRGAGRRVLLRPQRVWPAWLPWLILPYAAAGGASALLAAAAHRLSALGPSWACWPRLAGTAALSDRHRRHAAPRRHPDGGDAGRRSQLAGLGRATKATTPTWPSLLAATHTPWSAATNGSQSAATLEVASGTSVMAVGGWSGDPVPDLAAVHRRRAGRQDRLLRRGGPRRGRPVRHGEVIRGRSHSAVAHAARSPTGWPRTTRHRHRRIDGLPPVADRWLPCGRAQFGRRRRPSIPRSPFPMSPAPTRASRGLPRRVDLTLRAAADRRFLGGRRPRPAHRASRRLLGAAMLPPVAAGRAAPLGAPRRARCSWRSTPNSPREGPANFRFPRRRSRRGSRRAPPVRRRVDGPRPGAQHPVQQQLRGRQPGVARPVSRSTSATTSCMPSTGVTTTGRTRRCA